MGSGCDRSRGASIGALRVVSKLGRTWASTGVLRVVSKLGRTCRRLFIPSAISSVTWRATLGFGHDLAGGGNELAEVYIRGTLGLRASGKA